MRLHGSINAGTHTPWSFDAQTVEIYNRLSRLRQAAAPYVEQAWQEAAASGVPPTRPLWLAFPGDRQAARQDQQWMLGDDVLVAPVVEEGARSRRVYFPDGCWEHPETGERFEGPRHARVSAPLDRLPYFFACGRTPF
jgi:alpha-glucosidase (family GH31 glycosyl hydrolase)